MKLTREEVNLIRVLLELEMEQATKQKEEATQEIEQTKAAGRAVRPFDEEYLRYKEADLALTKRTMKHFDELVEEMKGGGRD